MRPGLNGGAAADARPLIVHVVHRFDTGGLENGVVNLINHMPAARWRHAIVAITEVNPAFASRIRRPDVAQVSLHKPPGQGLWLYPRLWRLFREWRPAVVHTRNLGTLEMQVPASLAGVPLRIHGEHGRDVSDLDGTNRRHRMMRRAYRPFVHRFVALGNELTGYLRDAVGVPAERLHTLYNGVDTQRFSPAPARERIAGCPFDDPGLTLVGTVGRMHPVKGSTLLAQAFARLLAEHPALRRTARLVMVGEGSERARCQAILESAGIADCAWLAGERADVPEVMRGLNCFVLPSLAEGISNTILEAMATALPVLATDVGANGELVEHGVTGCIVAPNDAGALAQGLHRLLVDREASARMGLAGRAVVERRFSLASMVAAYERIYSPAAARRPGSA